MNSFIIPNNNNNNDNIQFFFDYSEKENYISKSLHQYLNKAKKQIDNYYSEWDNIKKFTNPYEFIHTSIPQEKMSVSKLKPLSRSFYKMIEIVKLHNLIGETNSIKTFHIAEGPGGFIEATNYIRCNKNDTYYGLTLIDDLNDSIPGWKKSQEFIKNNENVKIEYGVTNDGDLFREENLQYVIDNYGNSISFITADGGFDFSSDFNEQESMASNLLFAEICYALAMQKKGGCFVLKMFDIFTKMSVDMIYLLTSFYKEIHIMKPKTSRSANSEKYIICKDFNPPIYQNQLMKYIIENFHNLKDKTITQLFNFNHDYLFILKLEEINALLGQQQIENIMNTFNIIFSSNKLLRCENNKKNFIQKCIYWCDKHNIPHNKSSFNSNIFIRQEIKDDGVENEILFENSEEINNEITY